MFISEFLTTVSQVDQPPFVSAAAQASLIDREESPALIITTGDLGGQP